MSARADGPEGSDLLGIRRPVELPHSVLKDRPSSFSGGPLFEDMRHTSKLMNETAVSAESSKPSSPLAKPPRPKDSGKSRQCSRFSCTVGENDLCDGDDDEDEIRVMHRPSQYSHPAD